MTARARRGGENGMNGERYEGGQFLPSTTLPKMTPKDTKRGTGKVEIAPYVWEVPPTPEYQSIYRQIAGIVARWVEYQIRLEVIPEGNDKPFEYYKITREQAQALVDAWNRGERWVK